MSKKFLQHKIHTIRGKQVILDRDLAEMYGVETRRLNEQVKRNLKRFPDDFCFQLNNDEMKLLRSQNATLESYNNDLRGKHTKYLPYAFTEQGVSMLSTVLKSTTAIDISVKIIRAFVVMRHFLLENKGIFQKPKEIINFLAPKIFRFSSVSAN